MITFFRIIKSSFKNFWRNSLLSIAATLVLSITLFTISIFVILTLIGDAAIKSINARIDIVAYFNDPVPEDAIRDIEVQVKKMPEVITVEYVSKEQALLKFKERTDDERLKEIVDKRSNPLPRSLEIKVEEPEQTEKLANYFEREEIKSLIHRVRFNKEVVDKLVRYTSVVEKMGLGLVVIFIVISIMLLFNTMRLAIYARRDEIEIEKLVGATISYIRWPFLVEGMLFGVLAALVSSLILILASKYLASSGFFSPTTFGEFLNYMGPEIRGFFAGNVWKFVLYQLALGIILSLSCSFIAIRKYLKL